MQLRFMQILGYLTGKVVEEQVCGQIESRLLHLHMSIRNISKNSWCSSQDPNPAHRLNFSIYSIDDY